MTVAEAGRKTPQGYRAKRTTIVESGLILAWESNLAPEDLVGEWGSADLKAPGTK